MLPLNCRLNLKKDFKWVVSGKFIDTKFTKLYLRLGNNLVAKIGIATSSKAFKKAVDRNKARRLTSRAIESFYQYLPSNLNMVALPKTGILSVKSGDVLLDLEDILREKKVINEKSNS